MVRHIVDGIDDLDVRAAGTQHCERAVRADKLDAQTVNVRLQSIVLFLSEWQNLVNLVGEA